MKMSDFSLKAKSMLCHRYTLLATCVVLAIAFRVYAMIRQPLLPLDSYYYIGMIKSFSGFRTLLDSGATIPPFFVVLLKTATNILGSAEAAGITLSFAAGILLVPVFYLIGKQISQNETIGLCCAFWIAIDPVMVRFSIEPLRESLYYLFNALAIAGIVAALRSQSIRARFVLMLCGGFAIPCALMVRHEGMELYLLLPLLILWWDIFHKVPLKRTLLSLLCVALPSLIIYCLMFMCFENFAAYYRWIWDAKLRSVLL